MDKKKYVRVDPFTGFPEKDVKEDVPTTSTAGVAATGDDPTVAMKKKKKKLYDGRTSIAKKFVERILKAREARRVTEEVELDEYNKKGIDKEIRKSGLKVGGKEAKLIHRLLKGRTKEEVELDEKSPDEILFHFKSFGDAKKFNDYVEKSKQKLGIKQVIHFEKGRDAHASSVSVRPKDEADLAAYEILYKGLDKIAKKFKSVKSIKYLQNSVKEEVELEEALKPKDKKVVDAFYDGKSMEGDTLSTDGKKLTKGGLGAQTIATSSGNKFKVVAKMDGKHTQSVVAYIKKSFPKNVVEEITEGTMSSGIFNRNPEVSNKSGYELTKFFKKKPNAKQAYDFVDTHIPDDELGDDIAALAGELDDAPGRLKDFPYKNQKKAYSKIDPRSVILNRLADFTNDRTAMLLVKTLMNMGVKPIKLGTGRAGKGEYDPIKTKINPSKIDAVLKKLGVSDPKQITFKGTFKEETMEITEEVMTLRTKDNVMGLKVYNGAKGLGLKAALLGKYVRVKGSKKQINDFGRTVIGKSSMGSPTDVGDFGKGSPTPQEDSMLNKRLKEELQIQTTFTASILEKVNEFGNEHELVETNLKVLQNIVKRKQNQKVKFKDKQATVDLFTANAIMKVYDAVKPDNKKKIEKLMNGTITDFLKLQKFAMKQVKFA